MLTAQPDSTNRHGCKHKQMTSYVRKFQTEIHEWKSSHFAMGSVEMYKFISNSVAGVLEHEIKSRLTKPKSVSCHQCLPILAVLCVGVHAALYTKWQHFFPCGIFCQPTASWLAVDCQPTTSTNITDNDETESVKTDSMVTVTRFWRKYGICVVLFGWKM